MGLSIGECVTGAIALRHQSANMRLMPSTFESGPMRFQWRIEDGTITAADSQFRGCLDEIGVNHYVTGAEVGLNTTAPGCSVTATGVAWQLSACV